MNYLGILLAITSCSVYSEPPEHWTKLFEWPSFGGLAFGNGRYVAFGVGPGYANGYGYYSEDGRNWARSVQIGYSGRDIAFGNGVFALITSASGTVMVSTNGESWAPGYSAQVQSGFESYSGISFANGRFIVTGSRTGGGPVYLTSTNGLSWASFAPDMSLSRVVFGLDRYVAVGSGGAILSSPDLLHWAETIPGEVDPFRVSFGAVAFGNGLFLAVNQSGLFRSADGVEWQSVPPSEIMWSSGAKLDFARDRFVGFVQAVEGQSSYSSTDGTDWIELEIPPNLVSSAATDGTNIVLAGNGVFGSMDGMRAEQWLASEVLPMGVYELPQATVILGTSERGLTSLVSTNGTTWARNDAPILPVSSISVVGSNLWAFGRDDGPYISTDGRSWRPQGLVPGYDVWALAEQNGTRVALGFQRPRVSNQAALLVSTNGSDWESTPLSPPWPTLLMAGNGIFVAAGGGNFGTNIYRWASGKDWQTATANGDVISLAFGEGKFVRISNSGQIWVSSDGLAWGKLYDLGPGINRPAESFSSVAYGAGHGGVFLAVGRTIEYDVAFGTLFSSQSTLSWVRNRSASNALPTAVFYAQDRFYLLDERTVYQSEPISEVPRFTLIEALSGQVRLGFTPQAKSKLYSSTDLVQWTFATNLMNTATNYISPASASRQYFRLITE